MDPSAVALDRFGSGATLEVGAIEKELALLWKDAGESSTREGGGPVSRACSMTLVAPCSNDAQFAHVSSIVDRVAARHPCRAILVKIDLESKETRLEAQVSAVCSAGGAQKKVCHEQIVLLASGKGLDAVASSALPLLIPDLPAYLWAPCERLLKLDLIPQLARYADAVLVDTHVFSEPFKSLARAFAIAQNHPVNRSLEGSTRGREGARGFGVHDLEWARLRPWFDALCGAFDCAEVAAGAGDVRSLRVAYASPEPARPRDALAPALFAGWFASRLDWPADGGAMQRVALEPRAETLRPGSLIEVEVVRDGGRVVVQRVSDAGATVRIESSGAAAPSRACRLAIPGDEDALLAALAVAPRDESFERAVPRALALATADSGRAR